MGGGMWTIIPKLTDEQVFEWWTSKKGIKKYYAETILQQKLNI